MNQRTHAWIVIRAIKLLEDIGQDPDLVKMLKPYTQEASIGAWIPDKRDAKLGGARTQNHIFKIGVYDGSLKSRFVVKKKKMLDFLGPDRISRDFIDKYSSVLDSKWWEKSYKANPSAGSHLANRVMALAINNTDMLILGNPEVQALLPGRIDFIDKVSDTTKCTAGQIAIFFFMLSHFIADSLMPCHCDERDLSDYDGGIHKELETHWSKKIGNYFDEANLTSSGIQDKDVLDQAGSVDTQFGISFQNKIPKMKSDDVWEEIVLLCRSSFAVASIMADPLIYPYKPDNQTKAFFDKLFIQDNPGKELLMDIDRTVMHDSVLNVAMIWKHIWEKFK